MRGKIWLLVLVMLGGGIGLMVMGAREFLDTRKLVAEGRPAPATVVGRREQTIYKDSKSSHVTVTFQAASGEKVTKELMVTKDIYSRATKGASINVIYFPKDPTVCIIGNYAQVEYTRFVAGCVFLGMGVVLFLFMVKHPNAGVIRPMTEDQLLEESRPIAVEGAQKVVKQMAPLMQTKHQFEQVDPRKFPHVDLHYYDSVRQLLESKGYVHLEDYEDVTLRQSANNPNTFIRAMLSGDGHFMAGMYHFKPPLMLRAAGVKEVKVLDLETQFSNGHFVCTSNAEDAGKLTQPVEVDNFAMGSATTPQLLLTAHDQRVKRFIEKTGAQPVRLQGMADVRKAQDELQRLKAEHRQRTGLTREELERIGGAKKGDKAADLMFDEIMKEHSRVNGKKSSEVALG